MLPYKANSVVIFSYHNEVRRTFTTVSVKMGLYVHAYSISMLHSVWQSWYERVMKGHR